MSDIQTGEAWEECRVWVMGRMNDNQMSVFRDWRTRAGEFGTTRPLEKIKLQDLERIRITELEPRLFLPFKYPHFNIYLHKSFPINELQNPIYIFNSFKQIILMHIQL
jgi:hypothetical protein